MPLIRLQIPSKFNQHDKSNQSGRLRVQIVTDHVNLTSGINSDLVTGVTKRSVIVWKRVA